MRQAPAFATSTLKSTTTRTRVATEVDVARRQAFDAATAQAESMFSDDSAKLDAAIKKIGAEPPIAEVGREIQLTVTSGGSSIFWKGGLSGDAAMETVRDEQLDDGTHVLVERKTGSLQGEGRFEIDFLVYHWLGVDLSGASKATLQALRLPPRVLSPFLFLILVSYITPRGDPEKLNRYFAKMKTEVDPDPEQDNANLEESYQNPTRFDERRLFPGTDWEFMRPRPKDVIGFVISVIACFVILAGIVWVAGIGA